MQQGRWEGRVVRCSEVRVVLRAAKDPFSNTLALGPALKKQAIFSPKLDTTTYYHVHGRNLLLSIYVL